MKNIIFIFISIICFYSCSGQKSIKTDSQSMSKEGICYIPDTIYNFFPDTTNSSMGNKLVFESTNAEEIEEPYFCDEFAISQITKIYEFGNKEVFDSLKKVYLMKSIFKTTAKNNDYKIIGSERDLLKLYDTMYLQNYYQKYKKPLIINFKEIIGSEKTIYDSSTICGINKDCEILVLKYGNNFVLPNKYNCEWSLLPNRFKHGYTSGVAYNDTKSYIIYWVVAW